MGIAYRADRLHGCTVSVWDGDVTAEDVRHHLGFLAADKNWPAGRAHLTDLTTMTSADVPDPELLDLLYEGTTIAEDLRIAVVVQGEPSFETMHRYEVATDKISATTFHDLAQACAYLGVNAPAMQVLLAELRRELAPTAPKGATMDHATTMRRAYECINAGDIDGFGDLLADDFVEHEGTPGLPPTKAGTLDFFRMLLAAFPDMNMIVEDVIAADAKAVARVTTKATHKGDFMGIPATGNAVEMQLIDIMRFNGAGLVCEHWGVADMLGLMQQLGAAPA